VAPGLGIAATLSANVAHGLGRGLIGAAVAAWSASHCSARTNAHDGDPRFPGGMIDSADNPGLAR